jgi:hypothetical protein
MAMSSVIQVLNPQAEELQVKRHEPADFRHQLVDNELNISTEEKNHFPTIGTLQKLDHS